MLNGAAKEQRRTYAYPVVGPFLDLILEPVADSVDRFNVEG